ncbi:hypothetical protein [endosymbiont GvMRE of Glomus versiforme]|uniref:hypothetical protein n=1 Tax=endosymbiont GvMRE of Glomus versiforme TaxID=2039283 RepID=UPI000EE0D318|nr:hypothetical protein [endosymbiont GvMRE of Glomus versiforme]RHZ37117.1 hypothetical protein GvMRE_I1g333 [endosymbiont GvMRE of Glomus versiforme]
MNDQNNQTKIKEQIKSICEKIYSNYRDVEEIKEKKIFGVPVWLKHVDKEIAKELKSLIEPLKEKSKEELDKYFHYRFWLSQHEEYDRNSLENCHLFVDNLTGLLGNLEEIISDNQKQETKQCSNCQTNLAYPCFGGIPSRYNERWCWECFPLIEKEYRGNKDLCLITREFKTDAKWSKTGMNWEGKHLVWKNETKSWWAVGFGEEEEIYRPADNDHDKHDNEQERERERERESRKVPCQLELAIVKNVILLQAVSQ